MANKYNAIFTKPPTETPKWDANASLGTKIETMFIRFIQRVITWGYEFVAELVVDIFDQSMKIMRPGLSRVTDPIINHLLSQPELPEWYKTALTNALNEKGESAWYIKLAVFYAGIFGTVTGGLAPIRRLAEFNADKTARSFLPSPQELATLHNIGLVSEQGFISNMAKLGLAEPLIPVYKEFVKNLPSLGELLNGLWRGVYSPEQFKAQLKRMGYDDKATELYTKLADNLPSIQDILRLLQREAFQDDIAAKYGYEEDFPVVAEDYFAQLGYDRKWAKLYYRANWTVPSPSMAYEMLHRGIIDAKTLDDILKIADYPPFWREKIAATSYKTITRVDLRRLFQSGLIPAERLEKGYTDLGYTPEDAKVLAEFAQIGNAEDEKDLTRSDVLGLYKDHLLDRSETAAALNKLGYDNQESEYLLDKIDFEIAKAERSDEINYAKEKFLSKLIDKTGVTTQLTSIGLSQTQIERYLLQWDRQTETKVVLPSKQDITKWFAQDYIAEDDFRNRLKDLGYKQADIDIYVKVATDAKEQSAEEEGTNELPPQEPNASTS